jgi:branched-chain amino acid transport system substrate-binding protein
VDEPAGGRGTCQHGLLKGVIGPPHSLAMDTSFRITGTGWAPGTEPSETREDRRTKEVKAKLATLLTAVLLLSLAVSACGAPAPPPEPTTPPEATAPPEATVPPPTATPPPPTTLYLGGTMSLTGPYAEDTAAVLAGYEDYAQYVNETKLLAPWRTDTFPEDATLEVLWRDDELKAAKMLPIYEELKAAGMLVYRIGSSDSAYALMDTLNEDRVGAVTMATGPYLLSPPRTIFTQYPIYTDEAAAVAEWFMENWQEDRAPRFAFLTADSPFGRSVEIDELKDYLVELGYELVGSQYVPMVPTAPPTTQLSWLKDNNVDLTFGCMINPGSQPTIKEAVRLGMGSGMDYEIQFAFALPSHLQVFVPAMGELGNGVIVAGGYPSNWPTVAEDDPAGIAFCHELQETYRPGDPVTHIMYVHGVVEAMIQVEALRLAMAEVPVDELTPLDVLEYGFYKIKELDTGGITSTPLTYGPGDIEGIDAIGVDQVQEGKIVRLGVWPARGIYKHE